MPAKKRRQRGQVVQSAAAEAKARDQDTTRLINEATADGHDIAQLRKLAAVRGLVTSELRAKLWPLLLDGPASNVGSNAPNTTAALGASPNTSISRSYSIGSTPAASGQDHRVLTQINSDVVSNNQYEQWSAGTHKDSSTVHVDVERSMYTFAGFLTSEERAARRQELKRLLNAVVVKHGGAVYYYQGLHDVASILLLVAGELPAFDMLCRLTTGHLRDATRPSLDPVLELLGLMGPIVEAADAELGTFLSKQGLMPFYALSWFITWFSHDLSDFNEVCRLFDLFLATHPLMPLYVGAAAMKTQRRQLLAAEEMPVLHSKLVNMTITRRATADQLAVQVWTFATMEARRRHLFAAEEAIELFKQSPPHQLIASRSLLLQQSVAPRVQLRGGVWHYPEPRHSGKGQWTQQRLQSLLQHVVKLPLPGTPAQRKKIVVASLTGVLGSLYVVAMCLFMAKGNTSSNSPFAMLYKL